MARNTKNPEERREEFVSAARSLFVEKGFEKTSVDDIVGSMGVAKGLFYYYFKTKEDVLYTIVDQMLEKVSQDVKEIMNQTYDSSALHILVLFKPYASLGEQSTKLFELFRNERNQEFYNYFLREGRKIIKPALVSIIERGVEENHFSVEFTPETADMLLYIGGAMANNSNEAERWDHVRFDIGGRLLGADPELLRDLDQIIKGEEKIVNDLTGLYPNIKQ